MLTFVGDGGAFDVKRGNTNAFFKKDDELILIDCGSKIFFELVEKEILSGVKKIEIFITHLHSDHAGGLASLCDYLNYANILHDAGIEFNIYYPNHENIKTILDLMLIENIAPHLHKPQESEYCKAVFKQKHFSNAYGYLFEIDGKNVYYSGDASEVNKDALMLLFNNQIDYFYHEASNRKTPWHTYLFDIAELVPEQFRSKVYLMHISSEMEADIKALGFNFCNTL